MKKITILILEDAVIEAIGDPAYLFNTVNQFLAAAGKQALFEVEWVALNKDVKLMDGLITVHPHFQLNEITSTDLIIIPALNGNMKAALQKNEHYLPWLIQQYNQGAEIASLCTGAFLLAATGLLNGKKCSTHWLAAKEFRLMFPEVKLSDGCIVTEDGRLYSSGGANSYWNLLLYLVEKFSTREMAILVAKYFAIDINRDSQSSFMVFQGQKNHNDEAVKSAQLYMEGNIQDRITVDHLAQKFAVGRRSFERRFKKATNNTVIEYFQRLKVEAAKRCFESSRKNITEVMYDVGYTDAKAFRDIFKRITGLSPIDYRNRYNGQQFEFSTLTP
ncbi:GlxA family transcriptional regulator [Pedobacter sp.]|uniref:GlxA family transcriptional regulator n=1 Tax=Pedobacter sp. TaxID=1411316 RepID=UPI003D7F4612